MLSSSRVLSSTVLLGLNGVAGVDFIQRVTGSIYLEAGYIFRQDTNEEKVRAQRMGSVPRIFEGYDEHGEKRQRFSLPEDSVHYNCDKRGCMLRILDRFSVS